MLQAKAIMWDCSLLRLVGLPTHCWVLWRGSAANWWGKQISALLPPSPPPPPAASGGHRCTAPTCVSGELLLVPGCQGQECTWLGVHLVSILSYLGSHGHDCSFIGGVNLELPCPPVGYDGIFAITNLLLFWVKMLRKPPNLGLHCENLKFWMLKNQTIPPIHPSWHTVIEGIDQLCIF